MHSTMPTLKGQTTDDNAPRHTIAELVHLRRQMLRYARSVAPGPERNEHLRIAISLRRLFRDEGLAGLAYLGIALTPPQ